MGWRRGRGLPHMVSDSGGVPWGLDVLRKRLVSPPRRLDLIKIVRLFETFRPPLLPLVHRPWLLAVSWGSSKRHGESACVCRWLQ